MASAGNMAVRLVASRSRNTPQNGWITTFYYEGSKTNILLAKVNPAFVANAIEVDTEFPTGQHGKLIVTFASIDGEERPDILTNIWDLGGNALQQRIFDHPKALELEAAHFGWLRIIEKEVEDYVTSDISAAFVLQHTFLTTADGSGPGVGAVVSIHNPPSTKADNAAALAKDLLRGVEGYRVPQYVLRNVRTVPASSSLTAVHENVEKLFTTAALQADVIANYDSAGIPSELLGTLPSVGYWQKQTPTVEQVSNGKWQLLQEWWYVDDYSTFLYTLAT